MTWMVQEAALGLKYAVVVAQAGNGERTELAVAITATTDGRRSRWLSASNACREPWRPATMPCWPSHRTWWDDFWAISSVTIPDPRLQRHYNLVKYFYGAASRPDAPPMPLQGVWTRDDGGLPPWKGDYHHDLNTQMTYLPYHAAGLTDCGAQLHQHLLGPPARLPPVRPRLLRRRRGRHASVATLAGKPTGGWAQYSLPPTNGLWVGHSLLPALALHHGPRPSCAPGPIPGSARSPPAS